MNFEECSNKFMHDCSYPKCPCSNFHEFNFRKMLPLKSSASWFWSGEDLIKDDDFKLMVCGTCRHWINLQDSSGNWIDWCRLNGSGFKSMDFCSKWSEKDGED